MSAISIIIEVGTIAAVGWLIMETINLLLK